MLLLRRSFICFASLFLASCLSSASANDLWIEYPSGEGPGAGKHVVLVSGDEEYRSEEALPQLAKILSKHHGFKCTVLFAINPKTGEINPDQSDNIPGLEALETADLMIIATRFRSLPDAQMKHIVDYVEKGKPVIGMRTATHAFNMKGDSTYGRYSYNYGGKDFEKGFGRQVLGETWISHHGHHKSESTRGLIADKSHPIATGIKDGEIWGPSDVYGVTLPLTADGKAIVFGQILKGMSFDDEPVVDKRNDPMMPVAWTRTYKGGRVFTTTMGAATDLENEALRRLILNAALWCVGREDKITADLNVSVVGEYKPSPFGFGTYIKGKKPADYQ
jgi:type 1 glutamine amidotransferase